MTTPFIQFQNVSHTYDKTAINGPFAVEEINLDVKEGGFVSIVGPSGCGKSTFMKLTTGLEKPTRGSIMIENRAVTGPLSISGMAFQAPTLLPWRTTLENVLLPLEIVEPFRSEFRAKKDEFIVRAKVLLRVLAYRVTRISYLINYLVECSKEPVFVGH